MGDSVRMSFSKSISDLNCDIERLSQRKRLSGDAVSQRLAVDKLHHYEGAAFFANFIDRADVGMIEHRGRPCFSNKPLLRAVIGGRFWWKEFDGDSTVELGVFSQVDLTHPARTEARDEAVMSDRRVRRERFVHGRFVAHCVTPMRRIKS